MKQVDIDATEDLLDAMKDPGIEDAMKGNILAGMHVESILCIDENPHLDKFMVSYGIPPNGAQMNEDTLKDLIPELGDPDGGLMEMAEEFRRAKSPEEKEKLRNKILDVSKNHMEVNFKDGASTGTINIVHKDENGVESRYALFEVGMRSRPIGDSPTLEIKQTNFMAVALSRDDDGNQLGTDVTKWPPYHAKKYYNGEIDRLKEELSDTEDPPTEDQKHALEAKIVEHEKELK